MSTLSQWVEHIWDNTRDVPTRSLPWYQSILRSMPAACVEQLPAVLRALDLPVEVFGMFDGRALLFVLLWTLAPLPIFLLVHVGEYGHVFSMLPGLCVLAGRVRVSHS